MGSKINRGFMFYFFLLSGIALGAFLVSVVIMIFVPGFSVFGISCVNEKYQDVRITEMAIYSSEEDTEENASVLLSDSSYDIENIEISSNIHSVKVFKSNNTQGINHSQFVVIFNSRSFGFTVSENKSSGLSVKYYSDTKTLRIEAVGPENFLNFGENFSITLQVPPTYSTENVNLEVKTNGNIMLGDVYSTGNLNPSTINFDTVNLQTEKTILVTNYTTIGEANRGDCALISGSNMEINTIIKANDLTIEAGEGTLTFNNEEQSFDLTGDLNIKTNNTFVHLGDVVADNIYLNNTYGKFYFTGSLSGNVFINKQTSSCVYEFININGNLTVGSYLDEDMVEGGSILAEVVTGEILMAMTGDISIEETQAFTQIKGTDGDIVINKIGASTQISTVDGDITLGEEENKVSSPIDLQCTGKGNVVVYFDSFEYADANICSITTESGTVDVYLVKNMSRDITAIATTGLTYLGVNIASKTGHWVVG
ncbi:MAG: hypothetical protein PHS54_05765, partial [Clostridia bacterium]|nr:hypothetical protein [Clostridia bacterium]